jgi:arginine utilization protein RocB
MGAVAAPLAIASSGLSIASGFLKGDADQAADEYQAQKARTAAEYAKTAADQTDAQMRENLNTQLENIDAVRAASGADPTSPTSEAVKGRTAMIGDRARSIQVGSIMAQAQQDEADANYLEQAGQSAYDMDVLGGFTGAAGKLAGTKWG